MAIYFSIQAGEMNNALILGGVVLVIAFGALAAIAYWKGKSFKAKIIESNRDFSLE